MRAISGSLPGKLQTPGLVVLLVIGGFTIGILAGVMPLLSILFILALVGLIMLAIFVQWPHALLCLFAFFLPYQLEFTSPQLFGATLNPQNVLIIALLAILFLKLWSAQRIPAVPLLGWWSAFVLLSCISFALGPLIFNPVQGMWVVYRMAMVAPLTYLVACLFLPTPDQVRQMMMILAFSAAVAGLIAVVQIASSGQMLSGLGTNHRYLGLLQPLPPEVVEKFVSGKLTDTNIFRGHGTFYTHNYFGAFLSMTICLTWGVLRGAWGWRRWGWSLVLAAQLVGSIATFSRTAWVATLAGLGAAFLAEIWFARNRRAVTLVIRLTPLLILVALVVLVSALQFKEVTAHFATTFNPTQVSEFQWRLLVWKLAGSQIMEQPWLGAGTSAIMKVPYYFKDRVFDAHNLFLDVAYSRGLITLGLFVFFVWQLLQSAWYWCRQAEARPERKMAVGVLAAGMALLVSGFANGLMFIDNTASLFWLMLGVAITMSQRHKYAEGRNISQ